ncbi:hypothetical protein NP493_1254g00008 [Ridgeia piscesae]|uniref:Uncharacterized protein n=1 Tax=Ridgeia piscesae TaxID=27915 RepID=A0AAD9K9W7_RIDPI|nr:hypothetical protein NP493_1254g00008 [Ridgeia piscesae]
MRCPVHRRFFSDQKIFHRWQPCPFEYVLVCVTLSIQVILMFARTQMPRLRIGSWTPSLHGISCL